jgi:N-acetylmuramoyl-L-alanine amidase
MTPRYIILHCSAAPARFGRAHIDRWHRERGWSGIGYHRVISMAPGVWTTEVGRDERLIGTHARGLNSCSLGLCISGSYEDAPPPTEALDLAARTCAVWCQRYDLEAGDVYGHREIEQLGAPDPKKTCPGMALDLDAFRASVGEHLDQLRALAAVVGVAT